MADFCLDCYNKLHHRQYSPGDVTLTVELEICEECGDLRYVIEELRPESIFRKLLRLVLCRI